MSSIKVQDKLEDAALQDDIAVIGMACIFPGAPDLTTYWQNILGKVDCIVEAPGNWSPKISHELDPSDRERIYCKRGGFLRIEDCKFNPIEYGIMPSGVQGSEPDQFLAVRVAYDAMADAGYLDSKQDRNHTAVVLGRGSYVNAGLMNLVQHGWVVDQTLQILKALHPEYTDVVLRKIREELSKSLPPLQGETVPGFVPNIAAGRIANRLDLMGPSFTVDAACASSLLAVENAARMLQSYECNLALAGGLQGGNTVLSYRMFCLIEAMSRRCQIRPFDKDADGTILGEGVGMVVLKRRSEAERDGDRIYAVIRGAGISSDGRALGLLAPRLEGAELAIRRAYEKTRVSPDTVGLVEAHGTGTPAGDITEVQALGRVFGNRQHAMPRVAIGSVKSMIGHSLGAAGIAGLIKTALALYHKVLPPTLNCAEPNPKLELEKTPFYINTETRPWVHGFREAPRRAGVNALGFGGINAHVILEEHRGQDESARPSCQHHWDSEVLVLQGGSRQELIREGQTLKGYLSKGGAPHLKDLAYTLNCPLEKKPYRLALIASTLEELEKKLDRALKRLANPQCAKIKDRQGIYFFEEPLRGKLAFLFPGEGSQYVNMLSDLCIHFPEVRRCFDRMDRILSDHGKDYLASDFVFPSPTLSSGEASAIKEKLWNMDGAVEAVLTANEALFSLLKLLEIRPDVVLGHSTGEYSAMRVSGIFNLLGDSDNGQYALELNRSYEQVVAKKGIPSTCLVSVGAHSELVGTLIEQTGVEMYVGMDNCPHQTVIVGTEAQAQKIIRVLDEQSIIYQILPFDRPYHTPLFGAFAETLRLLFERWPVTPPETPMYSCTTTDLYPTDPQQIRKLAIEHWIRPIEFSKTIERMYADGARIFIEVGPKGILTAFVDDILKGRDHMAVPANLESRSGITQLNHVVGILSAHGVSMNLRPLYRRRAPQHVHLHAAAHGTVRKDEESAMMLSLQLPLLEVHRDGLTPVQQKAMSETHHHGVDEITVSENTKSPFPANQGIFGNEKSEGVLEIPGVDLTVSRQSSLLAHEERSRLSRGTENQSALGRSDDRAAVMREYFQTMETFFKVQEDVMQTFLAGNGLADSPSSDSDSSMVESGTRQGDLQNLGPPSHGSAFSAGPPSPEKLPPSAQKMAENILDQENGLPKVSPADGPVQSFVDSKNALELIKTTLIALISQKTGYPEEMLDLNLDMEADLGIDSIKRIEVLGAFAEKTGIRADGFMEEASGFKRLQELIDFIGARVSEDSVSAGVLHPPQFVAPGESSKPFSTFSKVPPRHPLIDEIVSIVEGRELVALRKISLKEDRYLYDHILGGKTSSADNSFHALPIMPLTMSMELLAEAGSLLIPDKTLIGMKTIRAYRWISLEEDEVHLKMVARVIADAPEEVRVQAYKLDEHEGSSETLIIEGTAIFGRTYPKAPSKENFPLIKERPSKWSPPQLYTEGMFHGPSWQAVSSVGRWGENGSIATLEVLPADGFFSSRKQATFLTDPIILDAAGQVIAFWTMEHLERGFLIFPYELNALHIYRDPLSVHQKVTCRARTKLIGPQLISSNIDLLDEKGALWMRLEEWKDKRFDLPPKAYAFLLSPIEVIPSVRLDGLLASSANSESLVCHQIEDLFNRDGAFWRQVFAHLILNPTERETFRNIGKSERRKNHWLMGRLVAKDVVRASLKERYGLQLAPADVEIKSDPYGRPIPSGTWLNKVDEVPQLSLAHTDGLAVALAGWCARNQHIGIDLEKIRPLEDGAELAAFSAQEVELLKSFGESERQDWLIRLWSAKEALAKALGKGLVNGPRSFLAQEVNREDSSVKLTLCEEVARDFPDLFEKTLAVQTTKYGKYVLACVICERNVYGSHE